MDSISNVVWIMNSYYAVLYNNNIIELQNVANRKKLTYNNTILIT